MINIHDSNKSPKLLLLMNLRKCQSPTVDTGTMIWRIVDPISAKELLSIVMTYIVTMDPATTERPLAQLAPHDGCRRAQRVRLARRSHAHNLSQLTLLPTGKEAVFVGVVVQRCRKDLLAYFADAEFF